MSTPAHSLHRDQKPMSRPLWREAFVGLDWLALRTSPVCYGWGVPRGDGSPLPARAALVAAAHRLSLTPATLKAL